MIRLSNQELNEFILSFKRELKCHWKDNTLNQVYGYEIIQDLPPYCMYLDWNNKSYLLFDVDSILEPNIGYYILEDTLINSFDQWISNPDKDLEDMINLKFIIDNSNISIQSSHEEWGEDLFEQILLKYIEWIKNDKTNGALSLIPFQIKIKWKHE